MEYWWEILGPVVGEVAADPDGAFVQLGHFQLHLHQRRPEACQLTISTSNCALVAISGFYQNDFNEQSKTEVQGSNPGH